MLGDSQWGHSALLETRRLSRKAIAQHLAGYQAGASTRQLATLYGISKTSVQRLLQVHGVTGRHQGFSATQVTDARDLYRAGRSVAQVASNLGLIPSSDQQHAKGSGIEMRSAHEPSRR